MKELEETFQEFMHVKIVMSITFYLQLDITLMILVYQSLDFCASVVVILNLKFIIYQNNKNVE